MQNTPSSWQTWVDLRFNVWGLAAASAVTVFLAGLIKMVFHLMHRPEYAHYSSFGAWHFLAPVIHAILAGLAAAIFAAVYNAVSFRRASQT